MIRIPISQVHVYKHSYFSPLILFRCIRWLHPTKITPKKNINKKIKKIQLRFSIAALFRSQLASHAVGLRTLVSQVHAQRHSRIACHIVFRHNSNNFTFEKKKWILICTLIWIFFKIKNKKFFIFQIFQIQMKDRKTIWFFFL